MTEIEYRINTRNTTASTQQIEEEVRQLRVALSSLPERLNEAYQDRSVILDNYSATIQRFAQSAKSVITTTTVFERPPSPSIMVSLDEALGRTSYAVEPVSMDATHPVEGIESREHAESVNSPDPGSNPINYTESSGPIDSELFNFGNSPPKVMFQPDIQSLALATFEKTTAAKFIQFQIVTPISDVQLRNVLSEKSGIPQDEIEVEFDTKVNRSARTIEFFSIYYPPNVHITTMAYEATGRVRPGAMDERFSDTSLSFSTSLKFNPTRRVSEAAFIYKGFEDKRKPRTFDVFLKVGVAKTLPFSPSAQLSAEVAQAARDGTVPVLRLLWWHWDDYRDMIKNEEKRRMGSKQSRK